MSGKKRSFDIRSSKDEKEHKKRTPVRKRRRTTTPVRTIKTLRERREEQAQRGSLLVLLVLCFIVGGFVYLLWRPEMRIARVDSTHPIHHEAIAAIAQNAMQGSYWHLIPRDSFFFYPERAIRTKILDTYPVISSLTITRKDLQTIEIASESRVTAFWWCGSPDDILTETTHCYDADESGFIFQQTTIDGSSTPTFKVRALLDTASSTDSSPIRAHVLGSGYVPDILSFIQSIEALGTPITSVAIQHDEADLYTSGGTRIRYVIGQEKDAKKDARASFPSLNLVNGTIDYVDLRFPGRVYIKRAGEIVLE